MNNKRLHIDPFEEMIRIQMLRSGSGSEFIGKDTQSEDSGASLNRKLGNQLKKDLYKHHKSLQKFNLKPGRRSIWYFSGILVFTTILLLWPKADKQESIQPKRHNQDFIPDSSALHKKIVDDTISGETVTPIHSRKRTSTPAIVKIDSSTTDSLIQSVDKPIETLKKNAKDSILQTKKADLQDKIRESGNCKLPLKFRFIFHAKATNTLLEGSEDIDKLVKKINTCPNLERVSIKVYSPKQFIFFNNRKLTSMRIEYFKDLLKENGVDKDIVNGIKVRIFDYSQFGDYRNKDCIVLLLRS